MMLAGLNRSDEQACKQYRLFVKARLLKQNQEARKHSNFFF